MDENRDMGGRGCGRQEGEGKGPREISIGLFEKSVAALEDRTDFRDTSCYALLAERLRTFAEHGGKVLSLALFDTLLLRRNISETGLLWRLAQETAKCAGGRRKEAEMRRVVDHFVSRAMALEACRQVCVAGNGAGASGAGGLAKHGRVSIRRLLQSQLRLLRLAPAKFLASFLAIELQVAAGGHVACRPLLALVRDFAVRGGQVILVSDTMFSAGDVEALCRRCNVELAQEGVRKIYTAADHGLGKARGQLFAAVCGDLGLDASSLLHIGPSLDRDIRGARAAGCQSLHYPVSDREMARRLRDLAAVIKEITATGCSPLAWARA